ncbi:hypothetical protein [Pseudomonas aphyarum]|uniref:hypothetical protein n=1 Tax=Pseudomonas aphyarum TaxID=2942629 RepID=UPI00235E6105|nr:hypothetical protein [Pseudomonas aphyarum]MDD0970970.1 hypothetical protein [Pseudomonas aphyarum]
MNSSLKSKHPAPAFSFAFFFCLFHLPFAFAFASTTQHEAMPPDESRNEGTPSQSEGPNAGAQTFWFLLGRLPKGTRRKGETARSNTRKNGSTPKPKQKKAPQKEGLLNQPKPRNQVI